MSGNTAFLSRYCPSPASGAPLRLSRADVSFPTPMPAVQVSLWPWAVTKDCSKSGLGFLKRQSAVRIIREAHSAVTNSEAGSHGRSSPTEVSAHLVFTQILTCPETLPPVPGRYTMELGWFHFPRLAPGQLLPR